MAKPDKFITREVTVDEVETQILPNTTSNKPTKEELEFAKQLSGNPCTFNNLSTKLIDSLVAKGIAADFGEGKYGRGFRYFEYFS